MPQHTTLARYSRSMIMSFMLISALVIGTQAWAGQKAAQDVIDTVILPPQPVAAN